MNLDELRAMRAQSDAGELPSGLDVVLGPVDLFDLVALGKIPIELHPTIEQQMGLGGKKIDPAKPLSMKETADFVQLAGIVALAAIKEPSGITLDDLTSEDRIAVFNHVASKGRRQFGNFRPKSAGNVESAPTSNGVQPAAIVVPGA